MIGKIAQEEHFGIPGFSGYASKLAAGVDQTNLWDRLVEVGDLRLSEMDRNGVEMAVLSL